MATGALDTTELVDLALLLLVAGHETTASALALGGALLVEQHGGADAADPVRVAAVVEEVLRQTAVADGVARFATRDAEVGGVRVAAGEAVVVGLSAANRDRRCSPIPTGSTRSGRLATT